MLLTCVNPSNFWQLEKWKQYDIIEEFIVKFPINCHGKKKQEQQYKEIEMVKTNVGNYLKERFDFLWLSTSQVA